MNERQKENFRKDITDNLSSVRNLIRLGEGRGADGKQENFREIYDRMQALGHTTDDKNMLEAAKIVSECFSNRPVEILRPQYNMGNALKDIQGIDRDSTNVRLVYKNIDARLDIDQNKHQHPSIPIGTRTKGGGNRFTNGCDARWHQNTTLRYMTEWADRLPANPMGKKVFHGQTMAVNSIHYEGFCFFGPNDKRYVLFHCYPADNSKLKL